MAYYSIEGYLAALALRTKLTILVEGTTDKKVISRLLAEDRLVSADERGAALVDSVEIIRPRNGAPSNREMVELLHCHATVRGLEVVGLVDREFRYFGVDTGLKDEVRVHHVPALRLVWTRGHSIENYFFSESVVVGFLRQFFPEFVRAEDEEAICGEFRRIVRWAAALGAAALECRVLARCGGLLGVDSWEFDSTRQISLNVPGIVEKLLERGVAHDTAKDLQDRIVQLVRGPFGRCEWEDLRWYCHGHIGFSAIWTGTAAVLRTRGRQDNFVSDVALGHAEDKLRYASSWWSEAATAARESYPEMLVVWLREHCKLSKPRRSG